MVGAVVCCAAAIGARHDAGPSRRLPARRDALAAAGRAGARRRRRGARDGADPESARRALTASASRTAEQPNALLAPQAKLMASVARGVFGGGLPWAMIGRRRARRRCDHRARRVPRTAASRVPHAGAGRRHRHLSAARARRADIRSAASSACSRRAASPPAAKHANRRGLLFAAGLITGEALIGILMAIPIVLASDPEVFALPWQLPSIAGLLAVAGRRRPAVPRRDERAEQP